MIKKMNNHHERHEERLKDQFSKKLLLLLCALRGQGMKKGSFLNEW